MLEQIICEVGYDKNGHYTEIAQKSAYKKALSKQLSTKVSSKTAVKQTVAPQALVDSLEEEAYKSSLNLIMSKKEQKILSLQIDKQLAKGIFKLEKNISKERLIHAVKMCRIYADYDKAGTKIVLDAINTTQKLTPAQQKSFTDYVINGVGERGVNLMKKSIEKGNKNNHSTFNKSSKKQQKLHIKTLYDLKKARGHL